MGDYRSRVIEEKVQLADKIASLDTFITFNRLFAELSTSERERMKLQFKVMLQYESILSDRIEAMDNPALQEAKDFVLPVETDKPISLISRIKQWLFVES